MLSAIKYSVHFPTPLPHGRKLSADLKIGPGFWAIVGPNESGKSMVFEIASYLLWGTAALRGKVDSYKTLTSWGEFVIKGNLIEIERTTRNATMKRNGVVVATGTKPVNAKVIEELGFGKNVFDIANAINQGEVEALGKMKPTERKAMIDSVLGLHVLDNVVKWASGEATAIGKTIDGLRDRLLPPSAEPHEPPLYRTSSIVSTELTEARGVLAELQTINGWLAVDKPEPQKPETKIQLTAAELQGLADTRAALRNEVAQLEAGIRSLPAAATFTAELLDSVDQALDAYGKYQEAGLWLARNPKPEVTLAQVDQMIADVAVIGQYEAIDSAKALVEKLTGELEAMTHVNCPKCEHTFELDQQAAAQQRVLILEAERTLHALPEPSAPRPEDPRKEHGDLAHLRRFVESFDFAKHTEMSAVPPAEPVSLTMDQVAYHRREIVNAAERARLEIELKPKKVRFEGMADFEAMLAERKAYEAALAGYQPALKAWEDWKLEKLQKLAKQKAIAGAPDVVAGLEIELASSQAYERAVEDYSKTLTAYNAGKAAIVELENEVTELRKVREVMAVLRGMIKQHVLPSLNIVASQLLRKMTGGQRNLIQVDEEFDVLVDTQDLETLSGSGKACANLALRIALGQVLTHRILPMMLADEIDGSMDDDRAEWTAGVLQALQERVQQVLLVTHKTVDPNVATIRLGASE